MLRTRRRRWLLACALFFLAVAVPIAIAQIVTAQGEEASGVRHIIRTNASGELITAPGATATQVEGTTANAAAFSDNPLVIGGRDGGGDARLLFVATDGQLPLGWAVPGADTVNNAAQGLLRNAAGTTLFLGMFQYSFNGATWDRQFVCSESAPIATAGAGTTQIIALNGTTVIRICHISLSWDAAVDFRLVRGTGANCGTGTANLTADYQNTTAVALDFGVDAALRATAGDAVCMTQTGVGNSGGVVIYAQF